VTVCAGVRTAQSWVCCLAAAHIHHSCFHTMPQLIKYFTRNDCFQNHSIPLRILPHHHTRYPERTTPKMATFRTGPSAGENPPGTGQIFYIARFEFRRNAGYQGAMPIVASGIATIPREASGDWDLANIYTLTYNDQGARKVDAFMLNSMGAQERGVLLQALNKSAQYLVFKTGELVAVEERYRMPLHFLMLDSGPLFDEPAIIRMASKPSDVIQHIY
jgi:hypothetical protein